MKLIFTAFRYLKKHPFLSIAVLFSIIITALFDGASFGMLIPLIQSMTAKAASQAGAFGNVPFIGYLSTFLSSMTQAKAISIIFITLFILLLVKNIFIYISNILIAKLRFATTRDTRVNLMNNLLEYDTRYFDNVKTGHIIGNINTETERMGDFVQSVLRFIALSGRVLAYITLLFLISWRMSIVISLLIAVVLIPIELIMKKVKRMGMRVSEAIADYNHKLTEVLNGVRLIKVCGTEDMEKKNFKTEANNVYSSMYKSNKYAHLIIPLSEVCIFGLIVICFLVLINMTKIDMANTFPFIATYLLVLGKTLTQLNALNGSRSEAMKRLAAFTVYESMYDKKDKKTIETGNKAAEKFSDLIEIKDVNFSYIEGEKVLQDINVSIPKGKITALVGASGAGKSTLVNLIPRFYDVNSGEILVDGTNLRNLVIKEWRKKIGFVSQDIFIFNTSIKDNISYGRADLSEEEVFNAAKAANAHSFIMGLPDGYNTMLGERGIRLSGGQKQRISIARSIIHNPEVLILDEATSSLDTETERLITEAIDRLTKDRTVIAIAHRLSTILHADNIVVLDKGRIIESGCHADLLQKNGLYKRLYETQFSIKK
ncbi:ABC transporter ATP-binding protein [Candidatus Omnitrophota bacterium]